MKLRSLLLSLGLLVSVLSLHGQGPPPISTINAGTNVTVTRSGPSVTISSTGGSNAINLLITGSASPAANSASFSVPSGMVLTLSGSSPVTLSMGTGLNTFAGGLSSSGVLNVTNATASTGTTSGAAIIVGGLGLQGAAYIGGIANIGSATSGTINLGDGSFTKASGSGFTFNSSVVASNYQGTSGAATFSSGIYTQGSSNGIPAMNIGFTNTTYSGGLIMRSSSYDFALATGGPTAVNIADGTVVANTIYLAYGSPAGGGQSISTTIASNSGLITTYKGLTTSGSSSFFRVGATGTTISSLIRATATLASGVVTITNSAFTVKSVATATARTESLGGTVGVAPSIRYYAGSLSATATTTDNSAYDFIIYVFP